MATPQTESIEGLLRNAQEAVAQGKLDEAVEAFDRALAIDPHDKAAILGKATVLRGTGDYDTVRPLLDAALEERPDDADLLEERGSLENSAGQYADSLSYFRRVLEHEPLRVRSLVGAAIGMRLTNDNDSAARLLDDVLQELPSDAALWEQRGWVDYAGVEYATALARFEQALELDPTSVFAQFGKGSALRLMDDVDGAAAFLDEALAANPTAPDLLTERGWCETARGRHDRALTYFDRALEAAPAHAFAAVGKARSLRESGDRAAAEAFLDQALATHPGNAPLLTERGWLDSERGRYTDAIRWYDRALAIAPGREATLSPKVGALRLDGQFDAAQRCLVEALATAPDYPPLLLERGWLEHDRGRFDEAVKAFDRVLELKTTAQFLRAMFGKARALRGKGDLDAAEAVLELALRVFPDDVALRTDRGWLENQRDSYPSALSHFERALEVDPANEDAITGASTALRLTGELARAEALLDGALARKPDSAEVLAERGWLEIARERFAEALPYLDRSIELAPRSDFAMVGKAVALQQTDAEASERWLDQVLGAAPDNGALLRSRGWTRIARDNLDGAAEDFERAAELERSKDSPSADVFWDIGNGFADAGRGQAALDAHHQAITIAPEHVYARHNYANRLWQEGNYAEGRAAWDEARRAYERNLPLARKARNADHLGYYGWLLADIYHEWEAAHTALTEGLEFAPDDARIHAALVSVYRSMAETYSTEEASSVRTGSLVRWRRDAPASDGARVHPRLKAWEHFKHHERVVAPKLDTDTTGHRRIQLANVYIEVEEYDKATAALEDARERPLVSVLEAEALNSLGVIKTRRNDFKGAIGCFTAAANRVPNELSVKVNLAEAYLKDRQTEAAESEYKRILERAPRHVEAHVGLGEVYTQMADEDDDLYELAVAHFSDAIKLSESGTGSKRFTNTECAAVLYSRGYARTASYEAAGSGASERLLKQAERDFKDCAKRDPRHHKARRAVAKIRKRRRPGSPEWFGERAGPALVSTLALVVFVVVQLSLVAEWPFNKLAIGNYMALTFGSLVFLVAGLYLPRLSSLRVGAIGLEKSVVDQISTSGSLGIRK